MQVEGQYPYGTTITFSCDLGYNINITGASFTATCLDTGDWNSSTQECNIGKNHSTLLKKYQNYYIITKSHNNYHTEQTLSLQHIKGKVKI